MFETMIKDENARYNKIMAMIRHSKINLIM